MLWCVVVVVLLLLWTMQVSAVWRSTLFRVGPITTYVQYDDAKTGMGFIKTRQTATEIFLVQVNTTAAVGSSPAVCRNAVTVPVIVGARGCDSSEFGQAVESSNCALTDEAASRNKDVLEATWYMTYGSAECAAAGGDVTTCFGPVYIIRQNGQLPIDRPELITKEVLADSFGVCLITPLGPRGEVPAVTMIPVEYPKLRVNDTNCSDSGPVSFAGYYEPNYNDGGDSMFLNETRVYKRLTQATHQRLILKRTTPDGPVKLTLAVVSFDGIYMHEVLHTSIATVTTPGWLDTLPRTFTFTSGCTARVTLEAIPGSSLPVVLVPPVQLTDITYDKHRADGHYYQTSVCGLHFGKYTSDLVLVHPHTPDGDIGGGFPSWTVGDVIARDIEVLADKTWADYTIDCADFWPRQTSFRTFGQGYDEETGETQGTFELPFIAATFQCNAPFPNPLGIQENQDNPFVRYNQCYKLGGVVALRSLDYCRRPIQTQLCKGGWLYFDEYCYYKFNPTTDSKYKSSNALADDSCSSLFQPARSLKLLDQDLKAWLIRFFVFAKRIEPGHGHRVNVGGKRCLSFDYSASETNSDDDLADIQDTSCEDIMFPICRYHKKDYVVPHSEERWDPPSIIIQRDGQVGQPHPGKQLKCECTDGWTGIGCHIPTCGLSDVSGANSTLLTEWFQKCNLHGSCDNGRPRNCKCNEGYGPDAAYTQLVDSDKTPCACPAASLYEPFLSDTHTINGTRYEITNNDQVVCAGTNNGDCLVEPYLNKGQCRCTLRPNLNPDSLVKETPAFDGSMCTGVVPIVPPDQYLPNGDIVERYCNGIGFVCPSGERYSEQRLNEQTMDMFGRSQCRQSNGKLTSGCVCPSGWSGLACTCPVPVNILQGSILYRKIDSLSSEYAVYALFAKRESVRRVTVKRGGGCPTITGVFVQEGEAAELECTTMTQVNPSTFEWDCHSLYGNRLVVYSASDPIQCIVQASNDWFPPCGNNTNPTSGRYPANELQRSFNTHIDPQPSDFAAYGCTITHCMCDPGHGGALCAAAVSGFRPDQDKTTHYREFCGGSTFPARGRITNGKCECLKSQRQFDSKFTGDACELEEVLVEGTSHEYAVCNAPYGVPVHAQFEYGTCEFDKLDRESDPLNLLFVNVQPAAAERSAIFVVKGNTTVLRLHDGLEWKFWQFYDGQPLTVESLQPYNGSEEIENCNFVPLPLNFSIVAEGRSETVAAPRRMWANVTIWSVAFTCDNPVVDFGDPECYSTVEEVLPRIDAGDTVIPRFDMCPPNWETEIDYEELQWRQEFYCIRSVAWDYYLRHQYEVLETGTYYQSQFLCFHLVGNSRTSEALAYGVMDESDPLDRVLLDVAAHLELIPARSQARSLHTNLYGEFHGLFYRSVPGLTPFDQEWTNEHYRYIGSLLDDQICYDDDSGAIEERAYDGQTTGKIALQLYEGTVTESTAAFNPANTAPIPLVAVNKSTAFGGPEFIGMTGNPYIHLLNASLVYTHGEGRPGFSMVLPTGTAVLRKFSLRIPHAGIAAIQAFGPLGSICATFFGPFAVNATLHFDGCGSALMEHEERWVTLLRLNATLGLLAGFASYVPQHPITVTWWMMDDIFESGTAGDHFTEGDVSTTGRVTGYSGLFSALKTSVYVDHLWPESGVYATQCTDRKSGRSLRALNYSSPVDKTYLKRVWASHLAPRKCTQDWECKGFARNPLSYKCIFDAEFTEPWLGGDLVVDSFVGMEGGCLCTTGFAPHPCVICTPGYGPANKKELQDYLLFYNTTVEPDRCTIPWDQRTKRETGACGGQGSVVVDLETIDDFTFNVFEDNKTRRCESVTVTNNLGEEDVLELNEDNDFTLKAMTYGPNGELFVIDERIFLGRTELLVEERDGDTLVVTGGITLQCRQRFTSATHNFKWPGHRLLESKLSFWIAKLLYNND